MKIAVFKTGKHTDMNGQVREWTETDLDRIISQYDPANHEAPAVIGHPKSDAPAYGWVQGLSKEGGILYAEFAQMAPEFMDMLKAGLFKKRSISLYPDLTLKHVGFLGAAPPAVKGLPDYKFKDGAGESIIIEFAETKENEHMDVKEFFEALKFWKDATTVTTPEPVKDDKAPVSFTEADIAAAKKQAADEARAAAVAEFAEQQAKTKREARHALIKGEVDQMVAAGKIAPAWAKAGLAEFMEGLDAETEIQFAEGDAGKKSPLVWFREFLKDLPKVVNFSEVAPSTGPASGGTADKIGALVAKKMGDDKAMSYSEALRAVQIENPALVVEFINSNI